MHISDQALRQSPEAVAAGTEAVAVDLPMRLGRRENACRCAHPRPVCGSAGLALLAASDPLEQQCAH